MTDNLKKDLVYKVFTSRWPQDELEQTEYNKLYRSWDALWSKTYSELEGVQDLRSDDFERLNEVSGFYFKDEVIGVFCFNWYNLALPSHMKHSYFSAYPPEAIEKLKQMDAKIVMSMGNLAVLPDWRKRDSGLISEAFVGLGCKRFLQSDADFLIAYTRNDRKVNELCYRHGAQCLVANHMEHNVSVDIIAISRKEVVIAQDKGVLDLVENLWGRREVFGGQVHGQRQVHYRQAA